MARTVFVLYPVRNLSVFCEVIHTLSHPFVFLGSILAYKRSSLPIYSFGIIYLQLCLALKRI